MVNYLRHMYYKYKYWKWNIEIVEIVMFQGLNGSNPKSFGSKTVSLSKWGRELENKGIFLKEFKVTKL